jgi:hypothetical protein
MHPSACIRPLTLFGASSSGSDVALSYSAALAPGLSCQASPIQAVEQSRAYVPFHSCICLIYSACPPSQSQAAHGVCRASHMGANVTLSYKQPLLMVSASGCRMRDSQGREWLDTVNNVAHAGHCCEDIVHAQCQQLAQLNTNARYLSSVMTQFVDELLKRCVSPVSEQRRLSVVYLCNSGSEVRGGSAEVT